MDLNRIRKLAGLENDSVDAPSQLREKAYDNNNEGVGMGTTTLNEAKESKKDMKARMERINNGTLFDNQKDSCSKEENLEAAKKIDALAKKEEPGSLDQKRKMQSAEKARQRAANCSCANCKGSSKTNENVEYSEPDGDPIFNEDADPHEGGMDMLRKKMKELQATADGYYKMSPNNPSTALKKTQDKIKATADAIYKLKELQKKKQVSENVDLTKKDTTVLDMLEEAIVENAGSLLTIQDDFDALGLTKVANVIDLGETVYNVYEDFESHLWFFSPDDPDTIQETTLTLEQLQAYHTGGEDVDMYETPEELDEGLGDECDCDMKRQNFSNKIKSIQSKLDGADPESVGGMKNDLVGYQEKMRGLGCPKCR